MCERGKMLVTSIFSFSHNVFKMHFPLGRQKLTLPGKGSDLTQLNDTGDLGPLLFLTSRHCSLGRALDLKTRDYCFGLRAGQSNNF